MRLLKLPLQNWRNVALASLEFEGRQQFLVGANGQGKTSLLKPRDFSRRCAHFARWIRGW